MRMGIETNTEHNHAIGSKRKRTGSNNHRDGK
jgi:hypothetical protein